MRDLAAGLRQQMFYWGQDVVHPSGNLLVAQGFVRKKLAGLQGTSCYGLEWQGGRIELHGACAGWYGPDQGFIFIRPEGRCRAWMGAGPPVPGDWPAERLSDPGPAHLRDLSLPFLDWWAHSEHRIGTLAGPSYRLRCHRLFKRLPRSRPWLPPEQADRWLRHFRADPVGLERAKHFPADRPQ